MTTADSSPARAREALLLLSRLRTVATRAALGLLATSVLFSLSEFALIAVDFTRPLAFDPPIRLFDGAHETVVEGGSSLFRFDPYLYWDLRPGAPVVGASDERIGPTGFRGATIELERSPGTLRVACLGDSSTFGLFCPVEESYPARLEAEIGRRLSGAGVRGVEALNAGVPGHTAFQGLQTLQRKVAPYSPDVVVLMFGAVNECLTLAPPALGRAAASDERENSPRPARRLGSTDVLAHRLASDPDAGDADDAAALVGTGPRFGSILLSHLGRFRTVQLLASLSPRPGLATARDELEAWRKGASTGASPPRMSVKSFANCVNAMIEIARASGARVIVLGPPRRESLRRSAPVVSRYSSALAEVARRWGVPYLDLEPFFDADPSLFIPADPVHPSSRGHALIAAKVAEIVAAGGG